MTAFFDENIRRRTLRAGAFGFLNKPFEDESLIRCLDKALSNDETGLTPQ
jgi:FixJ family two-component response regulator